VRLDRWESDDLRGAVRHAFRKAYGNDLTPPPPRPAKAQLQDGDTSRPPAPRRRDTEVLVEANDDDTRPAVVENGLNGSLNVPAAAEPRRWHLVAAEDAQAIPGPKASRRAPQQRRGYPYRGHERGRDKDDR
jgi:hypothetical protein